MFGIGILPVKRFNFEYVPNATKAKKLHYIHIPYILIVITCLE